MKNADRILARKPTPTPTRAADPGRRLEAFLTLVLVRCPRCGSVARCAPREAGDLNIFAPRRVVCSKCAFTREWASNRVLRPWGELALDDHFHLPLYLQTPCKAGIVWAYNPQHLEYLAAWIGSSLRERPLNGSTGAANQSYFSRLPRWMKLGRHRGEVMAAIRRLRELAEMHTS